MKQRLLYQRVWTELSREKSMIFMAGPRQAGKTTLAQILSKSFTNSLYFNWDILEHRTKFLNNPNFFEEVTRRDASRPLIILDEIHKFKDWKNYLKGIYDQFHDQYQFLVSGSGRLDIYQRGGDSLAGRYYLFHLWPFSIAELGGHNREIKDFLQNPLNISMDDSDQLRNIWTRLSEMSGFPEPFLLQKDTSYRRWSNTYSNQLIREDIRDLTEIKSIKELETLYYLLPSKVGSPLSIPSLASLLRVSYNSIRNWLSVFELVFLVFSVYPWTKQITRAIQKERKIYLWDFPRIKDKSSRFENMIAAELFRAVTQWNDLGYGTFSLHFIRNKEKQEVDFLIANQGDPVVLIEAKMSDSKVSPALKKFQANLQIPAVQLVGNHEGYKLISNNGQKILIAPAFQWLSRLP
ncbi:MAG: ATP-binding protein [Candidatus Aminicenantes bacterium]|nr:ATP-binding protein [Candidatus Aminicenantes bacterium]